MEKLNTILFPLINASAHPPQIVLFVARFSAEWLLYVVVIGLVLAWVRHGSDVRRQVFDAIATGVLALAVNMVIAYFWYHPRPFEVGIGTQFLAHAPDSSFPSDHGTILFALAFGLLRSGGVRFWSSVSLMIALLVAWARVYVGVHWPMDMAGSLTVAFVTTIVFGQLSGTRQIIKLRDIALWLYDWVIITLRIPVWLSPRSGQS